jgi:hypothetical protein
MTDLHILKLAASYTYSPTASASRNYTPPKPKIKPGVVRINSNEEKKIEDIKFDDTGVPKPSENKSVSPDVARAPFGRYTNDFKNCISGTGYGRRYWVEDPARNAYSLS